MFPLRRQRGEYRANGLSSFSRAEPVPKVRAGHGPVQMLAVRWLLLGTGTGIVPEVFAEIFRTLDVFAGCDISLGMLQQAKTRLANLHAVAADAPAVPFKSETFDVVTASFVLSHIREYRRALNEIHRVLRANGLLAASN